MCSHSITFSSLQCEDRRRCLEQQLAQIQESSEKIKLAQHKVNRLVSRPDSNFFTSYPTIKARMEELVLTEGRSLLVPLTSHEIPFDISPEMRMKLPTLGSVCGGRTPSELQAKPNTNKCDLLSLSWEMAGNISETQGFDVAFEQVQTDLGAVLGDVSDNHKYLQREPQYQRVTGKELRTYVDFLCPGYTYRFKVRSINAAGSGMWSDSVTAMCKDFPINIEYTKRIHRIRIPQNAHYRIIARGAKAIDGLRFSGGKGAIISATFSLKQGDVLIILCGGMSQRHKYSSGGGGGTFVAINEINRENLLIVAGEGGGTRGCDESDYDGANASLEPNGTDGLGREHGKGGIDGGPGEDAGLHGPCWGYGGAGALVDSNSGMSMSFVNGGNGGRNGGFGGGGAVGSWGGGGGGGFSGGGGGRGGGGGGSYVRSDATLVEKKVGNEGAGSIQIDRTEPPYPPESNPLNSACTVVPPKKIDWLSSSTRGYGRREKSFLLSASSIDSGYTSQSSARYSSRDSGVDITYNAITSANYNSPVSVTSVPSDPIQEYLGEEEQVPRFLPFFEASSDEVMDYAPVYTTPAESTGPLTTTQALIPTGSLDPSIQHYGEYHTVQDRVAAYPTVNSESSIIATAYPSASAIFNSPQAPAIYISPPTLSDPQQSMHHPPAEAPYQDPTDVRRERPHP